MNFADSQLILPDWQMELGRQERLGSRRF